MPREIKGIHALSQAFPPEWLFYVALNCYPRGQDPMEIDAMVVIDDQILLLEIKDWNPQLTQVGDMWFVGGQSRGRSAVITLNEKAKKLTSLLKNEIPKIRGSTWIEPRVILTGQATKLKLSQSDQDYVWSLKEACSIGDSAKRAALLKPRKISLFKLYNFEQDFDLVTGNKKFFQPLEQNWSGYRITEENVFVHPRKVWADHRAERNGESRIKALVRIWSFDNLPVGLNSGEKRKLIADRENKVFAYLSALESELVERNLILRDLIALPDEINTNHFEVRALTKNWVTLDRYIERISDDFVSAERLLLASALLNIIKELHIRKVSHRDIGARSIWLSGPTSMAITGFMSSQIPEEASVFDWLVPLSGYASPLPEDAPIIPSTGFQRDVYQTGDLIKRILFGTNDPQVLSNHNLDADLRFLDEWLTRALAEDPKQRHSDVNVMAEEFSDLINNNIGNEVDQTILDAFETSIIPYQEWPTYKSLISKGGSSIYITSIQDQFLTVKIWNGLGRGKSAETDLALIRLLSSANRIKSAPVKGLPKFIALGLSPVGPFVVYEHMEGTAINGIQNLSDEELLNIATKLVSVVSSLHELDCDHGDLAPQNILYNKADSEIYLLDPFDISSVGSGRVRTPAFCPDNWELISQQAIDRYSVLKIICNLLSTTSNSHIVDLRNTLNSELIRPVIETLDVASAAIQKTIRLISEPNVPYFKLTSRQFEGYLRTPQTLEYFISFSEKEGDILRYHLTATSEQFAFEVANWKVIKWFYNIPKYVCVAHESLHSEKLKLHLELKVGPEQDIREFFKFIESKIKDVPIVDDIDIISSNFNIQRHWQRMIDLEANDRIEILLTKEIASREDVSIFGYKNLGKDFDFDPDVTVDVYSFSNKKLCEVEHSLSDFPGTIALRNSGRRISNGDTLFLADRREQSSIDRRTKAVKKILDRNSAIPNLIEYFDPRLDAALVNYQQEISDDDLLAYNLNEGQKVAFRGLLKQGPVGLLQGPPGTGKTRFIASFVHWLMTKGGTRILIASQSHEAVNNVIESLVLLYKRNGGNPSLLRIGSKGITERIKPFHTAELRKRYRLKFDASIKFRFTQLASAKGISRILAHAVFELDKSVGALARRSANLKLLSMQDSNELLVDRERYKSQLDKVNDAFEKAMESAVGKRADTTKPLEELENAFEALVFKFPGITIGDINAARRILELTYDWLSSLASPERNFEEFLAKTRTVITATCVGVGQTQVRIDSQLFDWVIVDEAARCTPSELAVPIQLGRRVLLVGDHLQLMPMISNTIVDQLQDENPELERDNFVVSDFERSFNSSYGSVAGYKLTEQYRMDPEICKMVSRCFYEPHKVLLQTSPTRTANFEIGTNIPKWLENSIIWIDTSSQQNNYEIKPAHETTLHNEAEVDSIIRILESISKQPDIIRQLQEDESETPIGIICMYSGQKERVELAIARHTWDSKFLRMIRIDTVDAYQGKENMIVILSLVRANKTSDIGHVKSKNRCNVALSRAKEKVIIVGSKPMWKNSGETSPMAAVLDYILQNPNIASIYTTGEIK